MTFFNITRFHIFVMVYWQLSKFMAAQMLFPIFSNYVPKWRCNSAQEFGKNCSLMAECVGDVEYENNYFKSAGKCLSKFDCVEINIVTQRKKL